MENKPSILQHTMTWGAILGILLVIISVLLYLFDIMKTNMMLNILLGVVNIIIVAVFLVIGTKAYRDKVLGGKISYEKAFLIGLLIVVFSSIITNFYSLILTTLIDTDYLTKVTEATKEWTYNFYSKKGMSEDQIEDALNKIDERLANYSAIKVFFIGLIWSTVFGIIISLITSAFVKRDPTPFDQVA
jgi:hypothetical protein